MSNHLSVLVVLSVLMAVAMPSLRGAPAAAEPTGRHLVARVLPWVGEPATEQPAELVLEKGHVIVAIGDSITQAGGYLRFVQHALNTLYPELEIPPIINAGIGGQRAEDLLARFQQDVVERDPAVVTLSIGVNDVWHRLGAPHDENVLANYRQNVARMVDMAQAGGSRVILLTPTVIEENPRAEGNRRLVQYIEALKDIAREKDCGLADLHGMFLSAMQQRPAEMEGHWLTSDGVHMSPLGDAVMAVGVLRALGVPDQAIADLD